MWNIRVIRTIEHTWIWDVCEGNVIMAHSATDYRDANEAWKVAACKYAHICPISHIFQDTPKTRMKANRKASVKVSNRQLKGE